MGTPGMQIHPSRLKNKPPPKKVVREIVDDPVLSNSLYNILKLREKQSTLFIWHTRSYSTFKDSEIYTSPPKTCTTASGSVVTQEAKLPQNNFILTLQKTSIIDKGLLEYPPSPTPPAIKRLKCSVIPPPALQFKSVQPAALSLSRAALAKENHELRGRLVRAESFISSLSVNFENYLVSQKPRELSILENLWKLQHFYLK